MLKTYKFKIQCNGDIHSSKTSNAVAMPPKIFGAETVNLLCPRIAYIFFGKTQCLFSRPSCTVNTCRLFSRWPIRGQVTSHVAYRTM